MIEYLQELQYKSTDSIFKIEQNKIHQGINLFEDIIIFRDNNNFKLYDRVCDHAGGKLIHKDEKLICPVHNWQFNPENGLYKNGVYKKEIQFKKEGNFIKTNLPKLTPKITHQNIDYEVKIRFYNHAFLIIETKNIKFATDPWALGPAFNNGWWLKYKTKIDWVSEINSCDFIFISHNHPDHLHRQTLSYVRKDMNFLVPAFVSDSAGIYLQDLKFSNIFKAKFGSEYKIKNSNMFFSIFKSGDFREDSGLYFSIGNFKGLIDVDSNNINFFKIPNIDFYASSLGGIASGFPLMFENYNLRQKKDIIKISNNFQMTQKKQRILRSNAKYFMPYAGFSTHYLERDSMILTYNKKILPSDYQNMCKKNNVQLLDVTKFDTYKFIGQKLVESYNVNQEYLDDLKVEKYLKSFKNNYQFIDEEYIQKYFVNSGFLDNLILVISLTDDNFMKIYYEFLVDFSNSEIKFKISKNFSINELNDKISIRYLHLKIRKESFLSVIYNKEAWEDLSIGFQCVVNRKPNLYNSKFWHHFTNIYITKKNVRSVTNCNNCEALNQELQNELKPVFEL